MHPASVFHTSDPAVLVSRLRENPFGTVMANGPSVPAITHAPILVNDDGSEIRFHLSKGNALVALFAEGAGAKIVITGPQAYVSPDWYGVPDQAPTWNYMSVEAEGFVQALDNEGAAALLDASAALFETPLLPKKPWTRHKMSEGVFERMLLGIVAYRMPVTRLVGTTKLSQNKPEAARAALAEALGPDHFLVAAMRGARP